MPTVLWGLECFQLSGESTGGKVALEFQASLGPAFSSRTTIADDKQVVDVYRLEPVDVDQALGPEELCLVRLQASPGFDCRSLEDVLQERDDLQLRCSILQDSLLQLGEHAEASEELSEAAEGRAASAEEEAIAERHQAQALRRSLDHSERTARETEESLKALRRDFLHLVETAGWPQKKVATSKRVQSEHGVAKRSPLGSEPATSAPSQVANSSGGPSGPGRRQQVTARDQSSDCRTARGVPGEAAVPTSSMAWRSIQRRPPSPRARPRGRTPRDSSRGAGGRSRGST